ncbi:hemolysin activation protein [Heliobacterium chlorum]|uniref:Hemolysin activation protein n=1 Tax=Heliobacterium chlorum TaxID=2698 RepID=A0ABR7T7K6_HELCL|nr:hemolysin activation protein [Heliobacterium chlorum]MBC9785829.1 hemolysin activation protein [Heliobacterium chlorum]
MKKPFRIDVAVLLIFFARPEQFRKVFEQVKIAKPSKLFLYQDGPRENNPDDITNIIQCRQIAEDIDWECEVYKMYQERNYGCDPSEFIAQKWAFSIVDECIVLEDDDVPAQSFFSFCKELLDRYRFDERINMICGMNNTGVSEHTPYSYLFSTTGSICGWASWKRVIDSWDESYSFLDDDFTLKQLEEVYKDKIDFPIFIRTCTNHRNSGKAHYESILSSSAFLNSRLNIVPAKNMISNIGVTDNATHSLSSVKMLPSGIRRIFNMKTYEIDFPLKHPEYVVDDVEFRRKLDRIMANGHPFVKFYRAIESILLRIRYGDFRGLWQAVKKRVIHQ